MRSKKAMTLRLSADQADQLETIAAVDGQPIAEVVRTAITAYITERKKDDRFQEGLRQHIDRARSLLDK